MGSIIRHLVHDLWLRASNAYGRALYELLPGLHPQEDDVVDMVAGRGDSREIMYESARFPAKQSQFSREIVAQDIFAGSELAERAYDGVSGHISATGRADTFRASFTCIVRVKPDFSMGERAEMPIIFCASPPYNRNAILHLILRGRSPELGFGYNNLPTDHLLPEHAWSWLAFVYDANKGRRILVDGKVVSKDRVRDCFTGDGNIEVGHWTFDGGKRGGFKGSLAGLICLEKALSNHEVRELLQQQGFQMPFSDLMLEIGLDMGQPVCDLIEDLKDQIGRERLRKIKVFKQRAARFADVLTDSLVMVDDLTQWQVSVALLGMSFPVLGKACDLWFASLRFGLLVLPFIVTYICMWASGIASLRRQGVRCPKLVYSTLGLPTMVLLKCWLLFAKPFNNGGHTQLSFLGAFDELDFLVEAMIEAPMQSTLNLARFLYIVVFRKSEDREFPYMLSISCAASLLMMHEAYSRVRERQHLIRDRGSPRQVPTLLSTMHLFVEACMCKRYINWDTPLGDVAAMEEFRFALTEPSSLEELILYGCRIEDVALLGEALKSNETLVELNLNGNLISDISPLAEALKTNVKLEVLSLKGNRIADVSLLLEALKTNSTLKVLRVEGNPLSDTMKEILKVSCENRLEVSV